MLHRFSILALLIFTVATANAASLSLLKGSTPADRVVTDLTGPFDAHPWTYVADSQTSMRTIASTRSAIQSLFSSGSFEGANCEANVFADKAPKGAIVLLSQSQMPKGTEIRFSTRIDPSLNYSATIHVLMNKDGTKIETFMSAVCQGTRVFGLMDDCYVRALCRAKAN